MSTTAQWHMKVLGECPETPWSNQRNRDMPKMTNQ